MEKKLTKQDKIRRALEVQETINTPGWKYYILPEIEKEIKENMNIFRIDQNNIEKSYLRQKIKVEVYRGLIDKINKWIKLGLELMKEGESGKKEKENR